MGEQRLIIFCSEIETDLDQIRTSVSRQLAKLGYPELMASEVRSPESLSDAGWMALAVVGPRGVPDNLPDLESHVETLVRSCSGNLREDVLGLYVDPVRERARACLRSPGKAPRTSHGSLAQVLREVAGWMDTDAGELLGYFTSGERPSRSSPAGEPANLFEGLDLPDEDGDAEPDEDDRFVEAKLKLGRELMERYLGHRKEKER